MLFGLNGVGKFFFFKQKTAYEMRISDWSSDVCSSDLCPSPNCDGTRFWRGYRCNSGSDMATGGRCMSEPIDLDSESGGAYSHYPRCRTSTPSPGSPRDAFF